MADKEERIYILSKPLYPSVDGWKEAKENSMTRQEAIDKMSMALCNKEFKNKASAEDIDYCDRTAEVMLNALLEGGK